MAASRHVSEERVSPGGLSLTSGAVHGEASTEGVDGIRWEAGSRPQDGPVGGRARRDGPSEGDSGRHAPVRRTAARLGSGRGRLLLSR